MRVLRLNLASLGNPSVVRFAVNAQDAHSIEPARSIEPIGSRAYLSFGQSQQQDDVRPGCTDEKGPPH
jgi:hypothetical protein